MCINCNVYSSDARSMALDVRNIVLNVIREKGNMTEAEAAQYLRRMESQKRYSADVWSWNSVISINNLVCYLYQTTIINIDHLDGFTVCGCYDSECTNQKTFYKCRNVFKIIHILLCKYFI